MSRRPLFLGSATYVGRAFCKADSPLRQSGLPQSSAGSLYGQLGGDVHPRVSTLEVMATSGEDGKMHTGDDVELGPLDVDGRSKILYVLGDDDKSLSVAQQHRLSRRTWTA